MKTIIVSKLVGNQYSVKPYPNKRKNIERLENAILATGEFAVVVQHGDHVEITTKSRLTKKQLKKLKLSAKNAALGRKVAVFVDKE